jgi:hypothetical protein
VQGDDRRPRGAQSVAVRSVQPWVRRPRTPYWRKRRRPWRRPIGMPVAGAAAARASRDHAATSPPGLSPGSSVPSGERTSRPGGGWRPARSPRGAPLRSGAVGVRCPAACPARRARARDQAWKRSRTVWGWHASSSAMTRVGSPSQLRTSLQACKTPSARVCRHRADTAPVGARGVLRRHRGVGERRVMWAWGTSWSRLSA